MESPSLSSSRSDFPEASVVSLGRSTQSEAESETTRLLTGSLQSNQSESHAGTSWYAAVFLVINAALGAGLLNFPAAYHQCGGIVVAVAVQASMAVFIVGSMLILIYCAEIHNCASYQDVVYECCGQVGRTLCSVSVALYAFGSCVTYFIIIGDQWDKFLSWVYGSTFCDHWYMNRHFTISVSAVVLVLPLCFPRRMDFLKYPSIVGSIAIFYCVALVTVKYFLLPFDDKKCHIAHGPDNWMSVFTVIPAICFGYQCHLSLVPIYVCMKERTVCTFSKVIAFAIGFCSLSYTVTASFGYLTFGSCVRADVLSSYEATADVLVAVIVVAIKMYTSYPVLLFVGRAAVDSIIMDTNMCATVMLPRNERLRRIISTLVLFTASLLLALFAPDISVVIHLLGGLAAVFIFVFPGLCLLQLLLKGYLDQVECLARYMGYIVASGSLLVVGGFIFGLTTTQSIMNDFLDFGTNISPVTDNTSNHCDR